TTFLLQEAGAIRLGSRSCKLPCAFGSTQVDQDLFNFYIWQFLDAVPILGATDALHWDAPLVYEGALIGWLVIAFKVAVIAPLIQLVRVSWGLRTRTPRIRVRPWALRRVATPDAVVKLGWAPRPLSED